MTAILKPRDSVLNRFQKQLGFRKHSPEKCITHFLITYVTDESKNNEVSIESDSDNRSAIGDAVNIISKHLDVHAIVVMTESGATARVVSHYRPSVNIYGLSPFKYICNRMSLLWGVTPIETDNFLTTDDMLKNIESILVESVKLFIIC